MRGSCARIAKLTERAQAQIMEESHGTPQKCDGGREIEPLKLERTKILKADPTKKSGAVMNCCMSLPGGTAKKLLVVAMTCVRFEGIAVPTTKRRQARKMQNTMGEHETKNDAKEKSRGNYP